MCSLGGERIDVSRERIDLSLIRTLAARRIDPLPDADCTGAASTVQLLCLCLQLEVCMWFCRPRSAQTSTLLRARMRQGHTLLWPCRTGLVLPVVVTLGSLVYSVCSAR
jgi:hypothetical protein